MVTETNSLAKSFVAAGWPILLFLDTHEVDKPEPPYPPHCIRGTGEELLVPGNPDVLNVTYHRKYLLLVCLELSWLQNESKALLMEKDCINGFIGGIKSDGENVVVEWIKRNDIEMVFSILSDWFSFAERPLLLSANYCGDLYRYLCHGFCFNCFVSKKSWLT